MTIFGGYNIQLRRNIWLRQKEIDKKYMVFFFFFVEEINIWLCQKEIDKKNRNSFIQIDKYTQILTSLIT